jgi:hypothetical protein
MRAGSPARSGHSVRKQPPPDRLTHTIHVRLQLYEPAGSLLSHQARQVRCYLFRRGRFAAIPSDPAGLLTPRSSTCRDGRFRPAGGGWRQQSCRHGSAPVRAGRAVGRCARAVPHGLAIACESNHRPTGLPIQSTFVFSYTIRQVRRYPIRRGRYAAIPSGAAGSLLSVQARQVRRYLFRRGRFAAIPSDPAGLLTPRSLTCRDGRFRPAGGGWRQQSCRHGSEPVRAGRAVGRRARAVPHGLAIACESNHRPTGLPIQSTFVFSYTNRQVRRYHIKRCKFAAISSGAAGSPLSHPTRQDF